MMKIYWIPTQSPRRVLALVKHLGLPAEFIEANSLPDGGMQSPAYAALNPNMKAPTLVDGDFVLWESAAIMAHLCIQAGSDLWPVQSPADQVQVMRWMAWDDDVWTRAVGAFYFEHVIKPMFGMGPPDRQALEAAAPGLRKSAAILDAALQGRDHVACGRLTIADFHLASMACDWRVAEMPLAEFPNIVRWLDGLDRLPAWRDPWPKQG